MEANGSRDRERAALSDWKHGGASRDRTDDLIVANDALSQLSYSPIRLAGVILAEVPTGIVMAAITKQQSLLHNRTITFACQAHAHSFRLFEVVERSYLNMK